MSQEHLQEEEGASTAAVDSTRVALPADFICPKCDYDLGGALRDKYPECGHDVSSLEVEQFWKRRGAGELLKGMLFRKLALGAAAVAVMTGGAMVLAWEVEAALVAAVLCSIAVVGSVFSGWIAARFAGAPDRAALRVAWLAAVGWLNGPWLVLPIFAVGGLLSMALIRRPDSPAGMAFGLLGGLAWLVVASGLIINGAHVFGRMLALFGLQRRGWWLLMVVATLVVVVGSLLLGFVGMMFAADAAYSVVMRWW